MRHKSDKVWVYIARNTLTTHTLIKFHETSTWILIARGRHQSLLCGATWHRAKESWRRQQRSLIFTDIFALSTSTKMNGIGAFVFLTGPVSVTQGTHIDRDKVSMPLPRGSRLSSEGLISAFVLDRPQLKWVSIFLGDEKIERFQWQRFPAPLNLSMYRYFCRYFWRNIYAMKRSQFLFRSHNKTCLLKCQLTRSLPGGIFAPWNQFLDLNRSYE